MPREQGPEWENVALVQPEGTDGVKQVKNKCKLCEHVFHGGAMRIRKKEQQEAQDRQLNRAPNSASAALAKKQKTLAGCVSQGLPNNFHQRISPHTLHGHLSVHNFKTDLSAFQNSRTTNDPTLVGPGYRSNRMANRKALT
eukprot:1146556-Pelagomonas_calceolata.AAC.1